MKLFVAILVLTIGCLGWSKDRPTRVKRPEVTSKDFDRLKEAIKTKSEKKTSDAISIILSKDPKNLKALNALAVLYMNTDKVGLARLVLERALQDHPKSAAVYNNLGVIEIKQYDLPKAINYFRKSMQLQKKNNFASANLASLFLKFGNYSSSIGPLEDSYDDSKRDLSRGREFSVQVANNYAVALARAGESEKAGRIYEKILDGKSNDTSVMLNYAILLVRDLKKRKESIRIISKIKFVAEDPGVLKVLRTLEKELDTL